MQSILEAIGTLILWVFGVLILWAIFKAWGMILDNPPEDKANDPLGYMESREKEGPPYDGDCWAEDPSDFPWGEPR